MPRVVHPSARLSANGASALVDTGDRGFRVCDLPSGRVRWTLGEGDDPIHPALSASGNALAWIPGDGAVTVLTATGRRTAELAVPPERIRAVAVDDAGLLLSLLVAAGGEQPTEGGTGGFVVLPFPPGNRVLAEVELPVGDDGSVLTNDDFSMFVVGSSSRIGEERFRGAFVRAGGGLRPLWPGSTAPVAQGALALYGDWLFVATADGLAGWRRTGERVTLPGSLRERMIFSPDGSHLLAYRVEEVIEVTSERTLFRLIDLTSLREVRRASHLVENRRGVQFVLDAGLGLFEVRATRAGELAVKQLAWGT
jgi:hypothetical protein